MVGNNAARKSEPSHDLHPSIPHNVCDSKTPHLGLLLTISLAGQCSSWPCTADVYRLSLEPGSLAWRMPTSSFTFKTGEASAFSLHETVCREQYYQPPSACDDLPSAPLSGCWWKPPPLLLLFASSLRMFHAGSSSLLALCFLIEHLRFSSPTTG